MIKKIEEQNKIMLDDLIYFIKRVKEGSIRSHITYARYIKTVEEVTGKNIDEVLNEG